MPALIPGVQSTPLTSPTTADPTGSSALGKDDFLKLLMAQLANQDPTAPTDNSQFVAQLAQFSGLEAQQGTNARLDTMLAAQTSNTESMAVSFIGKQVNYRTDTLNLQAGLTATSQITLGSNATQVSASVVDSNGNKVRTMSLGAQAAGNLTVAWDGNDDGGNRQPPGAYSVAVVATDANKNSVSVGLQASGEITGVSFDGGVAKLRVNGNVIQMSAVTSINERTTP